MLTAAYIHKIGKQGHEKGNSMIPKICANCSHGSCLLNQEGQISAVVCGLLPVSIVQYPNHSCGSFDMSANPQVNFSEPEEKEQEE